MTIVIPGIEVKPPEKVPLWIIIVAVIAGVILLCVIIGLLWKVGIRWNHLINKCVVLKYFLLGEGGIY